MQKKFFRSGLSLIEVVIAMLMLGITVAGLFNLELVLTRGVGLWHSTISRMVLINNFFVTADKEKWYEKENNIVEKKIENPPTTLVYKITSAEKKDQLKKFPNIYVENVTASWRGMLGRQREESMVMLRYIPKAKKS